MRSHLVAPLLMLLPLLGCSAASDVSTDQKFGSETSALATDNGVSLFFAGSTIKVCWLNPGFNSQKYWAELAVNRTWGRTTSLTFQWYESCPAYNPLRPDLTKYLRINDYQSGDTDSHGQTVRQGQAALLNAQEAQNLGGGNNAYAISLAFATDLSVRGVKGRVEYNAVHEVGHVLGFHHEQDRPDNTPGSPHYCNQTLGPNTNLTYVTGFDDQSIMNYCADESNGYLSKLDRIGAHQLYGSRPNHAPGDFNQDGISDLGVFRGTSSNGIWYIQGSSNFNWGYNTDIPVPADYDGDGKVDYGIFRTTTGEWWVPGIPPKVLGQAFDIPVPGDYLGIGKAQFAVFRPSNSTWYIDGMASRVWGVANDIPVPGDWYGDGKTRRAVYRSSDRTWWVDDASLPTDPSCACFGKMLGFASDLPVPGDYLGEGKINMALFRPSTGQWIIPGLVDAVTWGTAGDKPVPGDYTGLGYTTPAVWRPGSTGQFFVYPNTVVNWGTQGDVPLPKTLDDVFIY